MEEDLLSTFPVNKVYKANTIWVATFFGGTLAAGYILAEKFKNLGQEEKVKRTWIITILSTIALFSLIFFVPGVEQLPNLTFRIISIVVANSLFQAYQAKQVTMHIENGGQVYSMWRVLLIAIIGLVVTMLIVLLMLLATDNEFLQAL